MDVLQILSVVVVFLHITSATRSHNSNSGVTECQDGLNTLIQGYYNQTNYPSCDSIVSDFDGLMSICRPSDPVQINTHMRSLMFVLSQAGCDLTKLQTDNVAPHGLQCYSIVVDENVMRCTVEKRDEALACLQKDTGSVASVLVYILRKAMTDVCSQPANCKTPYGTYTPLKGTGCTEYLWDFGIGPGVTVKTAAGTRFSTVFCQPIHKNEVYCE